MNTAYNEKTFNEFQRLQKCVADLIRCRGYFDASAKQNLNEIGSLARKMEVSNIVQQRNTIAIAGMQGSGKSTLIKNLYGFPENLLRINSNRGERVPVFITEKADLAEGEYAARRVYFDEMLCKLEEEIPINEVAKWSQSRDGTAYVELFVPNRYFHTEHAGFVLLPGFEKTTEQVFDEDYNSIMEYTLYFANAVVLTVKEDVLASNDIMVLLEKLGKNFTPHNCVFAVTSCDGLSEQACNELVQTLISSCHDCGLPINEEQIICTGEYRTEQENSVWKEKLTNAIDSYLDFRSAQKAYYYFLPMMEEIQSQADQLKDAIDTTAFTTQDEALLYAHLKKALKAEEKKLECFLDDACACAQEKVADRFAVEYGKIPGKYKTNKKLLLFNKRYEEIAEARKYVRQRALATLTNSESGKSELIHQVCVNLPTSAFYASAENHPTLLLGSTEEGTQLTAEERKDNLSLCNQTIRSYLDSKAPRVSNTQFPETKIAPIIANEFSISFLSMLIGNLDPSELPLRTEGIQATMKAIQKKAPRKTNIASAIALVDMLDGKSDIMRSVVNVFVSNAEKAAEVASIASGWAIVAVATVAVAKKGLDAYNQVIANQNAVGETWEYALKNAIEEQKHNTLDSFREAADKLLAHVQRTHEIRMQIDEQSCRITDAKYALADITGLLNSFYDKYADMVETRAL